MWKVTFFFTKKDLPRWEVLSNTKEKNHAMLYIKHKRAKEFVQGST
jgi:hypothetical protein